MKKTVLALAVDIRMESDSKLSMLACFLGSGALREVRHVKNLVLNTRKIDQVVAEPHSTLSIASSPNVKKQIRGYIVPGVVWQCSLCISFRNQKSGPRLVARSFNLLTTRREVAH